MVLKFRFIVLEDAKYLIPTLAVVAVGLQQKKQIANMWGLKLTLNIGTTVCSFAFGFLPYPNVKF